MEDKEGTLPKYEVMKVEADEDDTWDANDWCYAVCDGGDYVCICSSEQEAARICKLLNEDAA